MLFNARIAGMFGGNAIVPLGQTGWRQAGASFALRFERRAVLR